MQGADVQFGWRPVLNSPGCLVGRLDGDHHHTFPWRSICCSSEEDKEIFREREKLNYCLAPAEGMKTCKGQNPNDRVFSLTQPRSTDSDAASGPLLECNTNGFGAREILSSWLLTYNLLHMHCVEWV